MAITHLGTVAALMGSLTLAPAVAAEPAAVHAAAPAASLSHATSPSAARAVRVSTVLAGLDHPWDIAFLSRTQFLFTQRDRRTISLGSTSGARRTLGSHPRLWSGNETGLMAIELAPDFARSRDFYTCHGWRKAGGGHDVRVARWHLNAARTRVRLTRTLIKGLPSTSGKHGGCALVFGASGALYVGTGDAAVGRNPQRLRSGGGKVLRVNPRTGRGLKANPWSGSKYPMKRRVYSYGHRNVQGLARRGKQIWSVEQGSYRDDEVNRIRKRGNYGWNPVPGYDESVPMTDHGLPGKQRSARWRSGRTTIATSAGAWLRGSIWGSRANRVLVVTALKGEQLRLIRFTAAGRKVGQTTWLKGRYGRLRAVTVAPGGALYVSTSNGGGRDRILRVLPG